MVLYVRNNNIKSPSTVKVNTPVSQHTPINNGQGGVLPSAYADPPTNADGTQANLDFDPQTISNSTWVNQVADHHNFGNQTATPQPPQPDFHITSDGLQVDNRDLLKENTPPPVNNNPPSPSKIGGTKLTQSEYHDIIKQQKLDRSTQKPSPLSLGIGVESLTPLSPKVKKLELNAKDFFKGTKSGNFGYDVKQYKVFGKTYTTETKKYEDVNPFDDFVNLPKDSNAKKNQKALQKQFDLYKNISNF